jgi:hypothetical protein
VQRCIGSACVWQVLTAEGTALPYDPAAQHVREQCYINRDRSPAGMVLSRNSAAFEMVMRDLVPMGGAPFASMAARMLEEHGVKSVFSNKPQRARSASPSVTSDRAASEASGAAATPSGS